MCFLQVWIRTVSLEYVVTPVYLEPNVGWKSIAGTMLDACSVALPGLSLKLQRLVGAACSLLCSKAAPVALLIALHRPHCSVAPPPPTYL